MATSREDAHPLQRSGWRANGRLRYPATYTRFWDATLPEVRMARIIDAVGLHRAKKLNCWEAAEMLGLSERHFRRLRDAYEAEGAEGSWTGGGAAPRAGVRRWTRSTG